MKRENLVVMKTLIALGIKIKYIMLSRLNIYISRLYISNNKFVKKDLLRHFYQTNFVLFCVLKLLLSLYIIKVFELISLVSDLSPEAASMLLAVVIGGYTLIGGLGATFYVSYFNTMLIFILILILVVEVLIINFYCNQAKKIVTQLKLSQYREKFCDPFDTFKVKV